MFPFVQITEARIWQGYVLDWSMHICLSFRELLCPKWPKDFRSVFINAILLQPKLVFKQKQCETINFTFLLFPILSKCTSGYGRRVFSFEKATTFQLSKSPGRFLTKLHEIIWISLVATTTYVAEFNWKKSGSPMRFARRCIKRALPNHLVSATR